jgi:hypothetical protein
MKKNHDQIILCTGDEKGTEANFKSEDIKMSHDSEVLSGKSQNAGDQPPISFT